MTDRPDEGERVEIRYANGERVHAVGTVIAYLYAPTAVIRTDAGDEVYWPLELVRPVGEQAGDA